MTAYRKGRYQAPGGLPGPRKGAAERVAFLKAATAAIPRRIPSLDLEVAE